MKKSLLSLLLVCFTLFSCTDDLSVLDNSEHNFVENTSEITNSGDEAKALDAYAILKNYYTLNTKSLHGEDEIIQFPDYYGGSFVDGDKLVVYIIDSTENIPSILKENPNIVIQEGKYSFSLLTEIKDKLNDVYMSDNAILNPAVSNIDMFAISETNNRIEVYLKNCDEAAIIDFKHYIIDSPAITFIQSQNIPNEAVEFMEKFELRLPKATVTVYPGSHLGSGPDLMSNLTPGSLGYKATYGGKTGFVTAAHVAALNDIVHIVYDTNKSTPIAECTFSRKSGSVDVAFCSATDCNVSNNINGNASNVLSPSIYTGIKEGITVYLSGYQTQSSGKIKYLGVSSGGLSNLIASSYSSVDGDSGGLVYYKDNSKNYIVGIHRSKSKFTTGEVLGLSTNAKNITSLGISPSN